MDFNETQTGDDCSKERKGKNVQKGHSRGWSKNFDKCQSAKNSLHFIFGNLDAT